MVWTLTVSDMDSGCPRVPLRALERRHVACLCKAGWTARTRESAPQSPTSSVPIHSRSAGSPRGTEASMHRSRPFVLVILTAAAACSRRDPAEGNDILSARPLARRPSRVDQECARRRSPTHAAAITVAAAPSAADQQQAEELTRQAGVAEMHGDIQGARSLLRRASALDGTNKSAAYHLGRTSEALGDRTTAHDRVLPLSRTGADGGRVGRGASAGGRSVAADAASRRHVSDSIAVRSDCARHDAATRSARSPVRSRAITSAAAPRSTPSNRPRPSRNRPA